jgi:isopenicillin-N epimerase
MTTLPAFADDFLLRPDMAFFNHGSFGACPRPVFESYQNWQRTLEAQPVEFLGRRINDLLEESRKTLASFLNTGADNIVYVPNATYGVNIVAHSLQLQPGDEILGTDQEYGACERAWQFNGLRNGSKYVTQAIDINNLPNEQAFVDQLWQGVNERTKVLFISHITSSTATVYPLAELCRRARAEGIITVIDGAHAPGQIDIDLAAIDADFYTGNCHKWLCSPKSAAFLYARPEWQPKLDPLVVSWGWQSRNPRESTFLDYFEWRGTHDPAAYLAVPDAIKYQQDRDWTSVRAACHDLANQTRHRVSELTGMPLVHDDSNTWWSQMTLLPFADDCDISTVKARLWDEFTIEIPEVAWNNRKFLRLSIQTYNSPEQADRLIAALKQILGK